MELEITPAMLSDAVQNREPSSVLELSLKFPEGSGAKIAVKLSFSADYMFRPFLDLNCTRQFKFWTFMAIRSDQSIFSFACLGFLSCESLTTK
jgi:hypothetical protein